MRELFPEYYRLDEQELNNLWSECLFILDTNVLLDFYRYSDASRKDLFEVLSDPRVVNRLWLPHHAALEFQKNKAKVIFSQRATLTKFEATIMKELESVKDRIQNEANTFKKLTTSSEESIIDLTPVFDALKKVKDDVTSQVGDTRSKPQWTNGLENIESEIDELFSAGKVGEPYSPEKIKEIASVAEERFRNKVPPGHLDYEEKVNNAKRNNHPIVDETNSHNQLGDLIIWQQIIHKAKSDEVRSVVFITGDTKDDWFRKDDNKQILGPQPSLLKEFREETGKAFYVYSVRAFFEHAKKYLKQEFREETLREIKTIQKAADEKSSYNPLRKFLINLPIQLKSFLMAATLKHVENNKLVIVFTEGRKFHRKKAVERSLEIYELAKKAFGESVEVEFKEREAGGRETIMHFEPIEKLASDYFDIELPSSFWKEFEDPKPDDDNSFPPEDDLPF